MQVCTFTVGDHRYGIRVDIVREIIKTLPAAAVPLAPPDVLGLVNLRGRIVLAIDLRVRLGYAESSDGGIDDQGVTAADRMNLVIEDDDDLVSLVVDAVGDVVDIDERQREEVPANVPEAQRAMLQAVYKISDDDLLMLLAPDAALDVEISV